VTDATTGPLNPWLSIWRRPRATIQQIVDTNPEHSVVALAALSGIVQALSNATARDAGDVLGLPVILALVLLLGPFLGLLGVYFGAWLLQWTGRWLGGRATTTQLRASLAWGSVPMIVGGALLVPALLIAGRELFTSEKPGLEADPTLWMIVLGLLLLQALAALWSCVTMLKTIGQVQGFSAWRALGNSLLPMLIFVAIVMAVVAVIVLVR
jgi:hypothetical protein